MWLSKLFTISKGSDGKIKAQKVIFPVIHASSLRCTNKPAEFQLFKFYLDRRSTCDEEFLSSFLGKVHWQRKHEDTTSAL